MRKYLKYSFILICSLLFLHAYAETVQLGDLAPRGAPDGLPLNAGDVVIMQRILNGDIPATPEEILIGDVAPLGAPPDGINAADLLILQRAVLGLETLGMVNVPPPAPELDDFPSQTNTNPYPISGTAKPESNVTIYVGGVPAGSAVAAAGTGIFSIPTALSEGDNNIYAIADDGVDFSPQSPTVTIDFQYIDGGMLPSSLVTQTLNSNTRYTVSSNITVDTGETVTINAGAEIRLTGTYSITTKYTAALVINGTELNPVVFTYDTSAGTPVPGAWKGITIGDGNGTVSLASNINYAVIEYAEIGVEYKWADNINTLTNSIIRNNVIGIELNQGTPIITNNKIISNENGINVNTLTGVKTNSQTTPIINYNEIHTNSLWNIYTGSYNNYSPAPTVNARNNWWGTNIPAAISATIHDLNDTLSTSFPRDNPNIDFGGFLDIQGGTAQPVEVMPRLVELQQVVSYSNTTVYVVGDVDIGNEGSMIINQGVEVRAAGNYRLEVSGRSGGLAVLRVNGAALNPVVFTSNQAVPIAGDWSGIEIGRYADVQIDQATIEYASRGIYFNSIKLADDIGTPVAVVSNSTLTKNIDAIEVYGASAPLISNNKIYDNNRAFYLVGYYTTFATPNISPVVNNNQIFSNYLWNVYTENIANSVPPVIDFTNNWWGTADPEVIPDTIYDNTDTGSSSVAVINFGQMLDDVEGAPQQVYVNAVITTDTVLSGNVYLYGDIQSTAPTLTVSAGANLYFGVNASLNITGGLSAVGSQGNEITFLPLNPTGGRNDWTGVKFTGPGQAINVDYCLIQGASRAFEFENSNGNISNCVIKQNDIGIYLAIGSNPTLTNDIITDNNTGIYFDGDVTDPGITIQFSDIYNNGDNLWLVDMDGFSGITFTEVWWGVPDLNDIKATFRYGSSVGEIPDTTITNAMATAANAYTIPTVLSIDNTYISPIASGGTKDSARITTTFVDSPAWSVEIRDSANNVVNTLSNTGSQVDVLWSGEGAAGDGKYSVKVFNNLSLAATGRIIVDNTLPVADIDNALQDTTLNVVQQSIQGLATDQNFASLKLEVADSLTPAPGDYRPFPADIRPINGGEIYNWIINDFNAGAQETSGDKTLRLTVTDLAGNVSTDLVTLSLDHNSITNVSYSPTAPTVISPESGEVVTINYTIGLPATVYVRFYPENERATIPADQTSTLIAEIENVYATPGAKAITWNGVDINGNKVPDGAYRFEITAQDAQSSNTYFLPIPEPTGNFVALETYELDLTGFQIQHNHHTNDYFKAIVGITDLTNGPFRVKLGAVEKVFDASGVIYWDGRTSTNRMASSGSSFAYDANYNRFRLAPNSIFVKGHSPELLGTQASPNIEIKSDPFLITHSYDQVTNVEFTVSMDSMVTVTMLPPCMESNLTCTATADDLYSQVVMDNQLLTSDDGGGLNVHSFEWRGYDFGATSPDTNNLMVNDAGTYTYLISATSVDTGVTTEYRGSLQIRE